ncbi:MAG: mechanosensitive ion channel family protein [Firmicutes bacterium]|nr:mechanosensitive ion channel family protein [Bacillota bacterium]
MEFITRHILKTEIIAPVIILLVSIFLCSISKKIVYRIFKFNTAKLNEGKKKSIANLINNIIKAIIFTIAVMTILEIYGIDTKSLVASLGVVSLVAGLALQDLLKDFIVGISILLEGQYSIGDCISINGFKGEVLPSNLRTTKLKAYTGEIKYISNRNITEIINYSTDSANLIIDVSVAYESDIDKVKNVLDSLCERLKEEYKLKDISCLGVQALEDSSINFRLVVSTVYSDQFALDRAIKKEIVKEFNKNKITIPYNQVVVHNG